MTEASDLLDIIESRMSGFSKGQKRIAAFLTEHYDQAVYLTAARLGEITGVSESTVVRFANELGFDGYPKLQRALEELVKNRLTAAQRMRVSSERIAKKDKSLLHTILQSDSDRIFSTMEEIDQQVFDDSVKALLAAKKIYIVGGRSSAPLSTFLAFYLNLMLDNVVNVSGSNLTEIFEGIFRIDKDDVFIAISFPRYSSRTVKAMQYASKNGAKTIALTDGKHSPLSQYADFLLTARSDMLSFIDSLVAPLSVINALLVAISMNKQDELEYSLDRLEQLWGEYQVYAPSGNTDKKV
ncbi:MAG: MurR/RpiR family transcriptional regulator [Clostridia bacterium]|nr:MurR/RpiR family transcriptional regulator [Clostridia bacterium]